MKKYSKIAYVILFFIILFFAFFIYKVIAKNTSEDDINEKKIAELQYLETRFVNLFNEVNNIKYENYNIYATKSDVDKNSDKQDKLEKSITDGSDSSGSGGESSKGGSDSSGGDSSSSGGGENSSEEESDNKKYVLEEKGVLTQTDEVNWEQIKNDVEKLYTEIYVILVDFDQMNFSADDTTKFSNEYDNLTQAVKNEDKEKMLDSLSKLYNYLTLYAEKSTMEEKNIITIKTKNDIFKAYSILDKEEWENISNYIKEASVEFSNLIKKSDEIKNINKYNLNKAYKMINELQNAIELKDKEIFLIKYKNLLEELENV